MSVALSLSVLVNESRVSLWPDELEPEVWHFSMAKKPYFAMSLYLDYNITGISELSVKAFCNNQKKRNHKISIRSKQSSLAPAKI